jgi:hypothetical protein
MALIVHPVVRDLGGISVRRILPALERRSVGPFVFFDEMSPLTVTPDPDGVFRKLEVRPHPHIGLATLTWLFSGALMHRDSLGSVQVIHPGAVNLMTAGRGIVHSERASQAGLAAGDILHGAQFWLALPNTHEDMAPVFAHHPAASVPRLAEDSVQIAVVMGAYGRHRSPARFPPARDDAPGAGEVTVGPAGVGCTALCLDLAFEAGATLMLPADPAAPERAVYVTAGALTVNGTRVDPHRLLVLDEGAPLACEASVEGAQALVIGGAPLDGPRFLEWNFVASSKPRLAAAVAEWRGYHSAHGTERFPPVPGEAEWTPGP